MKIFAITSIILSSLLVVAWPLVFFFSAFLFDAPLHGRAETFRWLVVYWIWSYPLGFFAGIGYLIARRIAIKQRPWWKPPTAYLFLLPIIQFSLPVLVVYFAAFVCDVHHSWCG